MAPCRGVLRGVFGSSAGSGAAARGRGRGGSGRGSGAGARPAGLPPLAIWQDDGGDGEALGRLGAGSVCITHGGVVVESCLTIDAEFDSCEVILMAWVTLSFVLTA